MATKRSSTAEKKPHSPTRVVASDTQRPVVSKKPSVPAAEVEGFLRKALTQRRIVMRTKVPYRVEYKVEYVYPGTKDVRRPALFVSEDGAKFLIGQLASAGIPGAKSVKVK